MIFFCHGRSTTITANLVHSGVNQLPQWYFPTGLNFSLERTSNYSKWEVLSVIKEHKILGLLFDKKLSWWQHIRGINTSLHRENISTVPLESWKKCTGQIGPSRLYTHTIHQYLMTAKHCRVFDYYENIFTVKHILIECKHY